MLRLAMKTPGFWSDDQALGRILSPLSTICRAMTARRVALSSWRAPIPVICCGGVTVGGAGKTTVVIDLARRISGVHILTRGYGGDDRVFRQVQVDDPPHIVGDEALLLAQVAPTWKSVDRARAARVAIKNGARVLLMDDGLQNPSLAKNISILVVDGASGFGNGRLLPAGPLRESVATAAARCTGAVLIGFDATGATTRLPPLLPVFHADLIQDEAIYRLAGRRVVAFAGISRPEKFFKPLRDAGALVVTSRPFPDHYTYKSTDIRHLLALARSLNAILVTTPKDAARLPTEFRSKVQVIGVTLAWRKPAAFGAWLTRSVAGNLPPVC